MRLSKSLALLAAVALFVPTFAQDKPAKNKKEKDKKSVPSVDAPSPAVSPVPLHLTERDLDGKSEESKEFLQKYFLQSSMPYKIEIAEGKFAEREGKVLIVQKDNETFIAFYRPEGNAYVLLDKPAKLSTVVAPRIDALPNSEILCLVVKNPTATEAWRVFVRGGKVIAETFTEETLTK